MTPLGLPAGQSVRSAVEGAGGGGWATGFKAMDPPLPAETEVMEREADKDARRKIQFSVPSSVPTQLDPRQVEMVRAGGEGGVCACVRVWPTRTMIVVVGVWACVW